MKPEFVVQDFSGKHNEDLGKEWTRLNKAGAWKKQRTIVIIPAGGMIPAKVALSHWNLIFPPNQGVFRVLALGMEIGEAYSGAIQNILSHPELSQWEYVLTLEHDNMPPPDGLLKLIQDLEEHPELACVGGLYYTKGEGGVPQIWGNPYDMPMNFRPQLPELNGGLVEGTGTGMGFNLFRLSMFKDQKLRQPWFKTVAGVEGVGTQDLYFWSDARKNGYRCAVDCSVRVGHYDHVNDIVW